MCVCLTVYVSGSPVWCYPHWGWAAGDHPASHLTPYTQSHTHIHTHPQTHARSHVQHNLLVGRCWLALTHTHTRTYCTHMLSLSFSHTPALLHLLYCCVKSHSLLTSRKFVLSTGAHTHADTNTQKHTATNTHILTNATVTRPSLHSQGERKHQHHTHSLLFHQPQSTVCV